MSTQTRALYAPEAERALIGSVLYAPEILVHVRETPKEAFKDGCNSQIWAAILEDADARRIPNPVTVLAHVAKYGVTKDQLEALRDEATQTEGGPANVEAYREQVMQAHQRHGLHGIALEFGADVLSGELLADDIRVKTMDKLLSSSEGVRATTVDSRTATNAAYEQLITHYNSGDTLRGLSCGLHDVDKKLQGLQPKLYVLAGRPATGKTGFVMQVGTTVAMGGTAVSVFSLEMSPEELVERNIFRLARVDKERFDANQMTDKDKERLKAASERLAELPIYYDESKSLSAICARAREHQALYGTQLIIIDYLQLMESDSSSRSENRQQEISKFSRVLKLLSRNLKIPVLVLSQLNRELESRANKRPMLSDLRESGAIEQDADVVMFIYRDVVCNPMTEEPNLAELIVGKQRNGSIGTVYLSFIDNIVEFRSLSRQTDVPPDAERVLS